MHAAAKKKGHPIRRPFLSTAPALPGTPRGRPANLAHAILQIAHQDTVRDPDLVANPVTGVRFEGGRLRAAVLQPNQYLVMLGFPEVAFDRMAGQCTADHAGNGRNFLAAAAAHLIAQQAADHAAADGAEIVSVAFDFNNVDRFDNAAAGAYFYGRWYRCSGRQ